MAPATWMAWPAVPLEGLSEEITGAAPGAGADVVVVAAAAALNVVVVVSPEGTWWTTCRARHRGVVGTEEGGVA